MTAQDLSHWRQGIPCNSQVADYQQRIAAADQVIFMFPVWWELMPAMTKGFIDKVYAKNILYTAKNMKTKLNQPKIEVITTMTTPNWLYRIFFGSPLKKALFRGMFLKTRLIHFKWHNIAGLDQKSSRQKERILQSFSI
ncbi:hypothetical protein IV79_GL000495 [Pediococcus claussenii]|nr:hypothetical protein IV79_GL000495 [Pediococcus claussenii]